MGIVFNCTMEKPKLFIIAGCNGAGKTTASYTILPEILNCREFVNADEIAKGLSPFQPEKVAIEAGRIMLRRIDDLLKEGIDFAFETTLATRSYRNTILKAQAKGYSVTLLFFWLQNVELAKRRVEKRVSEGGHHIDKDVIERRYDAGIKNLFEIYLSTADTVLIYDNTSGNHTFVARKDLGSDIEIIDNQIYNKILNAYEHTSKK